MASRLFARKSLLLVACLIAALLAATPGCHKDPAIVGTPIGGKNKGLGMTKELVAFGMGGYLNEVAAFHFMAPDKTTEMDRAVRLVHGAIELLELDGSAFQLPRPASGDAVENTADYMGYLIAPKYPGRELGVQIQEKHGRKIAAYYALAIKPWVGAMLYVQNSPSETAKAAADAVDAAGKDADLPADVYLDVVSALRNSDVTHAELTRRISVMEDRIDAMLKANIK